MLGGTKTQAQTTEDYTPAIIVSVLDRRHEALVSDGVSYVAMARELRYAVSMGGALLTVPQTFQGILGLFPQRVQVVFTYEPTSVFAEDETSSPTCELLCFPTACSHGFVKLLKPYSREISVASFLATLFGIPQTEGETLNSQLWEPGISAALSDVRLVAGNAYVIHQDDWSTPLITFVYLGEPLGGSHLILCGNCHGFPLVFEYETVCRQLAEGLKVTLLRPRRARGIS